MSTKKRSSYKNYLGSSSEFKPYYQKENDFKRLAILYGFAGLVISPLFTYFIYDTDVPQMYVYIGLSFTVFFPLYIILCYVIPFLYNKLIHFFIFHLFITTVVGFYDLLQSHLALLNFFCFYALYAVTLYILQRLYPAIMYNIMVLILLLYSYNLVQIPEVSKAGSFGLFSVLAICSTVVLISRRNMINNVEDYSNYLRTVVNSPGIGRVIFSINEQQKKVLDYNIEATRMLKCGSDQVEKALFHYFTEEELQELISLKIGSTFKKTIEVQSGDLIRIIEIQVILQLMRHGNYWLLRMTDITDRIREKEELAAKERKYRNLYYRTPSGVFTTDLDSNIIECNEAFISMFEGEMSKGKKLFTASKRVEWEDIMEMIEGSENVSNYQTHFTLSNGKNKWFIFNWYIDPSTYHIEGTVIDLTEVQKANAALRQSEEKYRLIYEESNDAILLLDGDKIVDVNRKGLQLFGYPERELIQKQLYELSYQPNPVLEKEYKKNKQKLHLSKSTKFNWIFKGGDQKIEAEVVIVELLLDDKTYFQCVIHDLTELNEVVRTLEKNKQSFKAVLDNTPEGIFIAHKDEILYANPEIYRLTGRQELDIQRLFSGVDQRRFVNMLDQHNASKKIVQQQLEFTSDDVDNDIKKKIHVDVTLVATTFEGKEATLFIIKDISLQNQLSREMLRAELAEETNKKLEREIRDRIKAENKLQEQLLRTNAIFDSSANTLLLMLNKENEITYFNTHCQNYFWHLIKRNLKTSERFEDFFQEIYSPFQLRYFRNILSKVKGGESRQMESRLQVEGEEYWIELFINPIFDINGKVTELSLVAHDITEKKKTEQKIVVSLKEKEILLKEIHHRVKNNLQVISSILNLQSSFVTDKKTLEILDESRNRIRTMAIIHENLYRTTNFSSIDFTNYISTLSSNLIATYHVRTSRIKLITEMDEVNLVLDQAIPCGLLINELITNAIKYAFPEGKEGEIFIGLKEENEQIEIKIEDNGVGLQKDFNILKSDTLGLQLVATLVEQLEGQIKLDTSKGTKYLITFDKAKL